MVRLDELPPELAEIVVDHTHEFFEGRRQEHHRQLLLYALVSRNFVDVSQRLLHERVRLYGSTFMAVWLEWRAKRYVVKELELGWAYNMLEVVRACPALERLELGEMQSWDVLTEPNLRGPFPSFGSRSLPLTSFLTDLAALELQLQELSIVKLAVLPVPTTPLSITRLRSLSISPAGEDPTTGILPLILHSSSATLTHLKFEDISEEYLDFIPVSIGIVGSTLKELTIHYDNLDSSHAIYPRRLLKSCECLETLDIDSYNINNLRTILAQLPNPSLKTLRTSINFDSEGAASFEEVDRILEHPQLRNLKTLHAWISLDRFEIDSVSSLEVDAGSDEESDEEGGSKPSAETLRARAKQAATSNEWINGWKARGLEIVVLP